MSVATLLRTHREASGLSQNELARQAGVDAAYINRIEGRQQWKPSAAVTSALARALGLDDIETDRLLLAAGFAPQLTLLRDPVRRSLDVIEWIEDKRGAPLPEDGFARIELTVADVRALARLLAVEPTNGN